MFNFYGIFIALGILVGALVVEKLQRKLLVVSGELSVVDILPWVLVPGIAGARLYHVIDYWSYYGEDLIKIFFVWEGGLGIFGGILGGVIGLWLLLFLIFIIGCSSTKFNANMTPDERFEVAKKYYD